MSKTPRPIRIEGALAYIPLTKGYEAVIDAADVPLVSAWSWTAHEYRNTDGTIAKVYAYRKSRGPGPQNIRLHNVILTPLPGHFADHNDNDGLNNRRSNLRHATNSQNMCNRGAPRNNTSGAKGVYWNKETNRWAAKIRVRNETRFLGRYGCITAAAIAYAKACQELHGEFGRVA